MAVEVRCKECVHDNVCMYKADFKKFKEEVETVVKQNLTENPVSPFGVMLSCKNYASSVVVRTPPWDGTAKLPTGPPLGPWFKYGTDDNTGR